MAHKVVIYEKMMADLKAREHASEVLAIGDPVRIQNTITSLWDETGVPCLRNRRHIKRRENCEPTEGAFAIGGDAGTAVSVAAVNKLNNKFNEIRQDMVDVERQPDMTDCPSRNTRSQCNRSV